MKMVPFLVVALFVIGTFRVKKKQQQTNKHFNAYYACKKFADDILKYFVYSSLKIGFFFSF